MAQLCRKVPDPSRRVTVEKVRLNRRNCLGYALLTQKRINPVSPVAAPIELRDLELAYSLRRKAGGSRG
jgi:hypothetical protein